MATKIRNEQEQTLDQQTIVEQPAYVTEANTGEHYDDRQDNQAFGLDYLQAQRKMLDEQIKQAKAAMPQQTALDRVIAKQSASYEKFIPKGLASRVAARVAAGQDRGVALDQVVAFFVARANELLDAAAREPTKE